MLWIEFWIQYIITAYKDRSFEFITKLPPVSYYLKKAAKIKKGNSTPGRTLVGKVTMSDIEKIAQEKMDDLNAIDIKGAVNMVKGSLNLEASDILSMQAGAANEITGIVSYALIDRSQENG